MNEWEENLDDEVAVGRARADQYLAAAREMESEAAALQEAAIAWLDGLAERGVDVGTACLGLMNQCNTLAAMRLLGQR